MQEQVSASLQQMSGLSAPGTTPSLDEVREKIERRYANALGSAELAQNSVEGRMIEVQKSALDMAGQSRLDAIRAGMSGGDTLSASPQQQAIGSTGDSATESGQPVRRAEGEPS
jgi:phage shock protein A